MAEIGGVNTGARTEIGGGRMTARGSGQPIAVLNSAKEWIVPGLLRSTSTISLRWPFAQLLARSVSAAATLPSVSMSPGRPQSGAGAKSCAQYSAQPSLKAKPRPVWLQTSWVCR